MEASCQDKHWDVYVGRECKLNYVTHGLSPVTSGRKPAAPDSGCSATVDTADLRKIKVKWCKILSYHLRPKWNSLYQELDLFLFLMMQLLCLVGFQSQHMP